MSEQQPHQYNKATQRAEGTSQRLYNWQEITMKQSHLGFNRTTHISNQPKGQLPTIGGFHPNQK
jgi:hypothetical protein